MHYISWLQQWNRDTKRVHYNQIWLNTVGQDSINRRQQDSELRVNPVWLADNWTTALQNWDCFESPERYETGQFREGHQTQFPKRLGNFEVRKLAKGPKTRKILVKAKKYCFGKATKPDSWDNLAISGPKTRKILEKAERFELS